MRYATVCLAAAAGLVHLIGLTPTAGAADTKTTGVFYPPELIARARAAIKSDAWAAGLRDAVVEAAEPWMKRSDDELWSAMFGHTIKRSWMVWSNGVCPACRKSVPMYTWQMDAVNRPWKTRCPHCEEIFPKNDFLAFYRSGLDEHGVFDPARADRKLLFNTEHPDPADPLHLFGVDDGEGYVEGEHRWRFIGAYLVYGQWKQFILGGIERLADAWVLTGDAAYAHKAAVMLDRIADLYPTFDFFAEGVNYERHNLSNGYVSTWHDACVETRAMILAYDRIFDAIRQDESLGAFLAAKAKAYGLENPKSSFADIQRNIEERILRDPLSNIKKITSNYPQTDLTVIAIHAVLARPGSQAEVDRLVDNMIAAATAVDGVSGEKGLAGYGAIAPNELAQFLEMIARADPARLEALFRRHPFLGHMYRFHIDTWCMMSYYPTCGDAGSFGTSATNYAGVSFRRVTSTRPIASSVLTPSMYSFMHRLYRLADEPAFAQVLYHANGGSVDGLPHDLFAADPEALQRDVQAVIERDGIEPKLGDVNKQQWRLAILRSGEAENARAVWLDYDTGGRHSHADGMNLGLYARGLDLMPDLGYPPVQFGGWDSPRAVWYTMTAAHNTVLVDGKNQASADGETRLWASGDLLRAVRASAAGMIGGKQYERTVAVVDVSPSDFYVLDVFRVVGGTHHAKFVHSHFGAVETAGLSLEPAPDFGHGTQMRNVRADSSPKTGWSVDWTIDDRYKYLPAGTEVHLRYTDLTKDVRASLAEGWIAPGLFDSSNDAWIPRVIVERKADQGPLASTFIGVIEPYGSQRVVQAIGRLPLHAPSGESYPEPTAAVEVRLADGRSDLLIAADVENPLRLTPAVNREAILVQKDWDVQVHGELAFVRQSKDHRVERIALARGWSLRAASVELSLTQPVDFIEIRIDGERPEVVAGDAGKVLELRVDDRRVLPPGE